jgi:hypothetical protein
MKMITLEGYDSGELWEFTSASEVLNFLDDRFRRWWMEGKTVVTPAGIAFIRIT